MHARSGPATLSHAVFEMLYVELRSVLGGLQRARSAKAKERAKARLAKAKKVQTEATAAAAAAAAVLDGNAEASAERGEGRAGDTGETSTPAKITGGHDGRATVAAGKTTEARDAEASNGEAAVEHAASGKKGGEEEDREEQEEEAVFDQLADMRDDLGCLTLSRELQVLVSEVTMLLLCVSSTDSCRSLLSQPRWIAVLLRLLRLGPPYAQRRALRLLRRLLPHCEPESLAEVDGTQSDGVDWSIVTIVKEPGAGASLSFGGVEAADGHVSDDSQGFSPSSTGSTGRKMGRLGLGPPIVRVTSLSSSSQAYLIPARSLLCYFLDAIGGSYQTMPRPECLVGADGEAEIPAPGANDRGGAGGRLRELRSWYRGQTPGTAVREQGRSAWSFSQLEGPLVCESVSLLRTLLQTSAWSGVTATLLQDAFQRGNACLRVLAREAAEKAEAAASAANSSSGANAAAPADPLPQPTAVEDTASGGGAESSLEPGIAMRTRTSAEASKTADMPRDGTGVSSTPPAAQRVAREILAGAPAPPSANGTLLRTLGALSVLGGHIDMLYPGARAEIMPLDYGISSRGGGMRSGRSAGVPAWGVRMGRSVFGLSGLERAATGGGGGDGRGRGGGGFAQYGASNIPTTVPTGGGQRCMVVSLSLAEGQAEVVVESGGGGGAIGGGTGGDRKPRVVPLDCLQAVPNVPVRPGALPPGLAQRVLETLTLWCLDRSLNAAFSPGSSPGSLNPPQSISPPMGAGGQCTHATEGARVKGLSGVLSPSVLDQHLLVGIVRFQAAKAAQALLLHPPTASEFVKAASTPAPGRHAKGGAGAVLLEVASGVSSSAGMGDIGAMEELVVMLLSQWQFLVLEGSSMKVREARWVVCTIRRKPKDTMSLWGGVDANRCHTQIQTAHRTVLHPLIECPSVVEKSMDCKR